MTRSFGKENLVTQKYPTFPHNTPILREYKVLRKKGKYFGSPVTDFTDIEFSGTDWLQNTRQLRVIFLGL